MPRQKDPNKKLSISVRLEPDSIKRAKKLVTKRRSFNATLCEAIALGLEAMTTERPEIEQKLAEAQHELRSLVEHVASALPILRNVTTGLSVIEDALCYYPEFVPYVEELSSIRERLNKEQSRKRDGTPKTKAGPKRKSAKR